MKNFRKDVIFFKKSKRNVLFYKKGLPKRKESVVLWNYKGGFTTPSSSMFLEMFRLKTHTSPFFGIRRTGLMY